MATPLATEFESADDSTGLLLWRLTNRWQAAQRSALKPFGLTHVQFVLLASLTYVGQPVTQQQLADRAGTDTMMTSQVIRALEALNLVERADHPTDKRAKLLTATPAGRKLANRTVKAVEQCDTDFFAILGSKRTTFTSLLKRLEDGADA